MADIIIRVDMSAEEIIATADALKKRVNSDAHLAETKLQEWQSARQRNKQRKGTQAAVPDPGEIGRSMDDLAREMEGVVATADFELHLAKANALLATAMVRRINADGETARAYRAACKAALASAKALEIAAMTRREICTKLDVQLVEQKVVQIVEAIKYSRECRAEIGFWWRFRL